MNKRELPERASIRTAPQVCSSSPAFAWVNGCQFINVGEVQFHKGVVAYDTYVIR